MRIRATKVLHLVNEWLVVYEVNSNSTGDLVRLTLRRLTEFCTNAVQRHPISWKLAWEAVHRLPFLLPHDKSYRALRHFITIKPEGLFLDVGANDGISALSFRKFSKSYRILSLEPNPLLEPALRRLKSSDQNFDYKIIGAGSAQARARLFVPVYKNIVLHTFSSGDRNHILDAITGSFGATVAQDVEIEAFNCDIIPIDALKLNPTIVKIDAEGFDYAVLQGLADTITRARPFIVIEIGAEEYQKIVEYLRVNRYALLSYDLASDTFRAAPPYFDETAHRTSGHRNFFGIPQEFLGLIPVR